MKFKIRYGLPHVREKWMELEKKYTTNTLAENEKIIFKKLYKCFCKLAENPQEKSLCSHKIDELSKKYGKGKDVWESYAENKKPRALRVFWVYGPGQKEITILAIEPHPDSDKYGLVELSSEE